MFSKKTLLFLLVMVLLGLIAACGAQPEPQTVVETVVVTKEVEVPGETIVQTVEVEKIVKETVVVEMPAEAAPADENALPRDETLYFNGQQWGSVVGWNPYSSNNNNIPYK